MTWLKDNHSRLRQRQGGEASSILLVTCSVCKVISSNCGGSAAICAGAGWIGVVKLAGSLL